MQKLYLLFITLLFNLSVASANDLKESIVNVTDQYLDKHFLNASFMFASNDEVIHSGVQGIFALGSSSLKALQQMPIASATKTMTAAGILRLQDNDLLDVQDKIIKHFDANSGIWPNNVIPEWAKEISIHNLLTHTSGLAEYLFVAPINTSMSRDQINKEIVKFAALQPLAFTPGTQYIYTNTNFVMLGLIIEKISGMTLAEFFDIEFFKPLNMNNTYLATLEASLEMQANIDNKEYIETKAVCPAMYFLLPANEGEKPNQPKFIPAKIDFVLSPYADGGVVSNTIDLIKWYKALNNGMILSDKSYKMMITRYYPISDKLGRKTYTGYGIKITEFANGDVMLHHPGASCGIRSESGYIPAKQFYFAILSNTMIQPKLEEHLDTNIPQNQLDIIYFKESILKTMGY